MLDGLSLATFAGDTVRYHLLKAEAAAFRRNAAAERAHGDSARALIERRLRPRPDDAKMLATLALAHMHLRRHAEATRAGERAAELLPLEDDAVSGPFILAYLARVYAGAGRLDQATEVLERLAGTSSWITPAALRADPIWDPLRRHPGFRKLAEHQPSPGSALLDPLPRGPYVPAHVSRLYPDLRRRPPHSQGPGGDLRAGRRARGNPGPGAAGGVRAPRPAGDDRGPLAPGAQRPRRPESPAQRRPDRPAHAARA
jgi:hypothetical protein